MWPLGVLEIELKYLQISSFIKKWRIIRKHTYNMLSICYHLKNFKKVALIKTNQIVEFLSYLLNPATFYKNFGLFLLFFFQILRK